ncbi:hypothetical protein D3C75_1164290 [compost metagenome]
MNARFKVVPIRPTDFFRRSGIIVFHPDYDYSISDGDVLFLHGLEWGIGERKLGWR